MPKEKSLLKYFPNPVKDKLTLEIDGVTVGQGQILLFDFEGNLLKQLSFDGTNVSFDNIPIGGYMLKFLSANIEANIKIVKE